MAATRQPQEPGGNTEYARVFRNAGIRMEPEQTTNTLETTDGEGNVIPANTAHIPAKSTLNFAMRVFSSQQSRIEAETDPYVRFVDTSYCYPSDQVVFPPANWEPKAESTEDVLTQYVVAMCYLTWLSDPVNISLGFTTDEG